MAQAKDLIRNQHVVTVATEWSVLEVVRLMTERNIGAVAVMRDGELVGVFSERDVMTRVVAAARGPGSTRVAEVMTPNPRVVSPEEDVENCAFMMQEHGIRHLPVVEGATLKGMISLRDVAFIGRSKSSST